MKYQLTKAFELAALIVKNNEADDENLHARKLVKHRRELLALIPETDEPTDEQVVQLWACELLLMGASFYGFDDDDV